MYSDSREMPMARDIDSVASGNNSQLRADAVSNRHDKSSDLKSENYKRDALDMMEERQEAPEEHIWNDFVMLEDHELAHGYVAKYQRLCSRSELSASIHERFSARLESKRKLRISRRFSFVERQRRARERHQEYINKRRVRARKFIERREQVVQRAARTLEKRTKTFELRASRLDKKLLEQMEGDESPERSEEVVNDEEESVDVNDDVSVHLKRAEETLASKIEGIQANLKKKMESADERRRQLRAQERERLAKALQQVEKVQEKKLLEEGEKSVKLQEKLEEAERRRKQLLEEESLRRKQKWEKREEIISREQELEEKRKKSLEERVELAIERKNRIIEETKLAIQKKLTDAEELLNRNRIEMKKKLQEMAEKILQKQEKAEQLRIENLMRRKKSSSPASQYRSKSVSLASDAVSSPEPAAAVEGTVAG